VLGDDRGGSVPAPGTKASGIRHGIRAGTYGHW